MKSIAIDVRLAFIGMVIIALCSCSKNAKVDESVSFNENWNFTRIGSNLPAAVPVGQIPDSCWENITLPHTAVIEPLVIEGQQWTGICWYRKNFQIGRENSGKHVGILIGAAMNSATVWLNGIEIKRHLGGYLPFYLDISNQISFGQVNTLLIRLDNSENPEIPPGKLLKELDFNYYSGLYRNVGLLIKDKLHFSNAMEIDSLQGGGIMVHTDEISAETAGLSASVSIINQGEKVREFRIKGNLLDDEGKMAASVKSGLISIPPRSAIRIPLGLQVPEPKLWSPGFPFLYTLETELVEGGKVLETESCRIGIREIRMSATEGFTINGQPLKIRGTNRHQEYPYIGYALSDNAQYRDAWKIKQAGFNFVRSSHYPQSPAFLDACDELGILVMDAIPGWQFYGDSTFRGISYQNTREMCRRDRNHPSIILWEASLNETVMPVDFMQKSHEIVHAELPFKDIYTCGWMDTIYDVFIPARQHNVPPDYWNKYPKKKPLFIAEYGSWEYYAQNAGFNQTEFKDLKPADRSSRQLRGYGEIRLLQQAFNFMEAYNSNLSGPAIGSSNWVMYDYNRGYAPDIEPSGIMDIFRIPKFTWWFYKSQSDDEPVCFIASFHSPASAKYVRVFSNGDSVSLYRNGVLISARLPDKNSTTSNLGHPPFTFDMPSFDSGTLKAKAFKNGKVWAEHSITTPGPAENLLVEADLSNRELKADGGDVIFIYAKITDATGNILFDSGLPVHFTVTGDATLIGNNPAAAEGGIATILLKAGHTPGIIRVSAESQGLRPSDLEVVAGGFPQTYRTISRNELHDKIAGYWIGQLVGNYLGFPFEGTYTGEAVPVFVDRYYDFRDDSTLVINRNDLRGYCPVTINWMEGAFSDDDTDIEFVTLHALEKYGLDITYPEITEMWQKHINRKIWCANRTARDLMNQGFIPPATGSKTNNPNWYQIDPQLVNEIWSVVYPGMIRKSVDCAEWGARITGDDWGTHPTMAYAVMYSAAIFEKDVQKLVDLALKYLPEGSPFREGIIDIIAWHRQEPDWRVARKLIFDKYYQYKRGAYTAPVSDVSALTNGLFGIMAILYGNGDFVQTTAIAVSAGLDCDNQAATCGGLIGVLKGARAIPDRLTLGMSGTPVWEKPFNDTYINITRDSLPGINRISDIIERLLNLAELAIIENGGSKFLDGGKVFYRINSDF